MEITKFKNLLIRGYDVEFNIDEFSILLLQVK